jgi:hypothetical protein
MLNDLKWGDSPFFINHIYDTTSVDSANEWGKKAKPHQTQKMLKMIDKSFLIKFKKYTL